MRNKSDLDTLRMVDLYNNLKVYEYDIKGKSSSSSNSQNVAFVSSDNSSSTDEIVNTAHSVSATSSKDQVSTASYANDVMFSFFANQSNAPQLNATTAIEDVILLENAGHQGIRGIEIEMLQEGMHQWIHLLQMHCSDFEVHTCSKDCLTSYETLQKQHDQHREALNKSNLEIIVVYEEDVAFLKYDVQVKDISIKDLKNQLEEALKEKVDLKLKLEKFEESSKNLTKLINSQISDKDKTGLGYDSQMNESEVVHSVFNSRESDVDDSPVNDRFKTGKEFHAVLPPYTRNYMPLRPDLSFVGLDDSVYKTKPADFTDASSEAHKSHHKAWKREVSIADKALVRTLMAKLTTMKFDGSKSMQQHVLDMTNTAARLKTLGMNVDDSFLVQFIMNSLHLEYGRFHINYNTLKDKWNIDGLTMSLSLLKVPLYSRHMCLIYYASTPQQNDVVERRNRTLMEMVRSMISKSSLPKSLWIYSLRTTVYLLNKVPSKSVLKTHFDLWTRRKPSPRHLHVWGSPVEAQVYNPQEKNGFSNRNAKFLEKGEVSGSVENQVVDINKIRDNDPSPMNVHKSITTPDVVPVFQNQEQYLNNEQTPQEENNLPTQTSEPVGITLNKPARVRKLAIHDDYIVYLQETDFDIGIDNDHVSFSQAIRSNKSEMWINAMKEELKPMA
ncbi:ribonuclease H-like domain-containing protein [Tanacetum coccineum]